ncbi:MAG: MotA/TolQ/ExbB proton channel family protein [Pseudomonadota bacterium]
MLPLALVCLVMWLLIANRLIFFRRLTRNNMSRREAAGLIRENRLPDAAQYQGAVFFLVEGFLRRRKGNRAIDKFILDETEMRIRRSLDAYLEVIRVLAALAPLLGLLGTVTGMINTFEILTLFGTGNPKGMASGISEALITTETGLVVAIPGLYLQGFLARRARNQKQMIRIAGHYLRKHL